LVATQAQGAGYGRQASAAMSKGMEWLARPVKGHDKKLLV